jgi:hypothetical protein
VSQSEAESGDRDPAAMAAGTFGGALERLGLAVS